MLAVIRKDLIMNRNAMLLTAVMFVAFVAYMVSQEDMRPVPYVVFSSLMFAFVPLTVVTREDKFRALTLGCSLPATRRTIVSARYVLSVSCAVTGIAVAMALAALLPFSRLPIDRLLTLPIVLFAVTIAVLVISLLLPFSLRFGASGLIGFLVATQVLGILLLVVSRLTRYALVSPRAAADSVRRGIQAIQGPIGEAAFSLLLVVVLALVLMFSYAVAVEVFERREL